jgi:hypothetical protein
MVHNQCTTVQENHTVSDKCIIHDIMSLNMKLCVLVVTSTAAAQSITASLVEENS